MGQTIDGQTIPIDRSKKMNALSVMEHLVCKLKQHRLERMNENLMNEKSLSIPKF